MSYGKVKLLDKVLLKEQLLCAWNPEQELPPPTNIPPKLRQSVVYDSGSGRSVVVKVLTFKIERAGYKATLT